MVLPGWNVSEPLGLAVRLYRISEQLRSAPEEARTFTNKIVIFRAALNRLQKMLEYRLARTSSPDGLADLMSAVAKSELCVERCENLAKRFQNLSNGHGFRAANAAQATRFVWKRDEIKRFVEDMDSYIQSIVLFLNLEVVELNWRDRTIDHPDASNPNSLLRAETAKTPPPYAGPVQEFPSKGASVQPADLLGPDIARHVEATASLVAAQSDVQVNFAQNNYMPLHRSTMSGSGPRPSSLVSGSPPAKALLRKPPPNRNSRDFSSLEEPRLESRRSSSYERKDSFASTSPSIFARTPPESRSPNEAIRARTNSISQLDDVRAEASIEGLQHAFVSFDKAPNPVRVSIHTVQLFSVPQKNRRYLVFIAESKLIARFYIKWPASQKLIPHVEHPEAYDPPPTNHQVSFQDKLDFSTERSDGRRLSTASSTMTDTTLVASSAASIRSMSSVGSSKSESKIKKESSKPKFEFENWWDFKRFQELLLGPGVELLAQVPIDELVTTRGSDASRTESNCQCLRVWKYGGYHYLMYFANLTTSTYVEYPTKAFKQSGDKSKTSLKLEGGYLGSLLSRRSISTSPGCSPPGMDSSPQGLRFDGLTRAVDFEELTALKSIVVKFSTKEGKRTFLEHAPFS